MNRLPFPRAGLFAALVAMAMQLGFASSVPNPSSTLLLGAASGICHHTGDRGGTSQHHSPATALCPFAAALNSPAPVLGASPSVPLPPSTIVDRGSGLPQFAVPPPPWPDHPQPRGPPPLA
ncbi:MAG: hypothetical protein JO122_20440 [Acetobacteraceae bacterium]|nr:hypothetical protein [Acetobacteraceae bacterium]